MSMIFRSVVTLQLIISCAHAALHQWEDCLLEPKPVSCPPPWDYTSVTRYYFDQGDSTCKEYPRGKECSLNANYFETTLSCTITCVCSMPVDVGQGSGDIAAYFFNTESNRCEEFSYKGSGGNANRFSSLEKCKEQCLCTHPMDEGTCHEPTNKFFFNGETGQCEEFTYNGCRGNPNRFSSAEECSSACP